MEHLNPSAPKAKGPSPTVFCYLCGRQFGSKSIIIHEPQCIKKWEREQAKLPKHLRKPMPVKPEMPINADGKMSRRELAEAQNEAAWQASQANMVQCEHCNRSFNPDRLGAHQRSCTADNPHKKVPPKPK